MTRPPWLCRLVPYLGRRQAEADLQDELRHHLELEHERRREAGVPERDAMRLARRKLGNTTLIRERTRDVWGWRWFDDLVRDLRHAVRGLRRNSGFAMTVVIILALGIGANTAMFSIVYGMLLRPLPYPDAAGSCAWDTSVLYARTHAPYSQTSHSRDSRQRPSRSSTSPPTHLVP